MTRKTVIIDAKNGILGRVASNAAKLALLGNKVIIVNCNLAILSGRKRMIINEYITSRIRGGSSLNGPHFPKEPFRIMKRTVRGMLSYTQERGRTALKNVICHNTTPIEYESVEKISFGKESRSGTITLGDLSKEL